MILTPSVYIAIAIVAVLTLTCFVLAISVRSKLGLAFAIVAGVFLTLAFAGFVAADLEAAL